MNSEPANPPRAKKRHARARRLNELFAKTEKHSGGESWYKLDTSAIIMPSVTRGNYNLVFRIAAMLDEDVHLPRLSQAMERLVPRFPYFMVDLRAGFFWHYLQPLVDCIPAPVADSVYPCVGFNPLRHNRTMFRVRAFRNRIAVEFSHILTDGKGALEYLRALLTEYFRLGGIDIPDDGTIMRVDQSPHPEESEDAYNRHFIFGAPPADGNKPAFHVPSLPLLPGQHRIMTATASLASVLALAKSHGATLTEFAAACLLASLQDIYDGTSRPFRRRSRIVVDIPIDLRRFFPSRTMRNFILLIGPWIDMRLGHYDFPEIVKRVHHYMQNEVHPKPLSIQMARNVSGVRAVYLRALPLFLKKYAMRWMYDHFGENTISVGLSNLGPVSLPQPVASKILEFEFIPPVSRWIWTNLNLVSWGDVLSMTFGSIAASTELERLFFTRLAGMGIELTVRTNMDHGARPFQQ